MIRIPLAKVRRVFVFFRLLVFWDINRDKVS